VAERPHLPNPLRRQVLVEAGHRCAIPTCRQVPVEIAHIEPRKADGSNDTFQNLIALCPTCHTRYDKGEIDRPSMRQYKVNLGTLNSRYGEMERRLLDYFASNPGVDAVNLSRDMDFEVMYLRQDGMLSRAIVGGGMFMSGPQGRTQIAGVVQYGLTDRGKDLVSRWTHGQAVEEDQGPPG
jgi:hypothetical protein